MIRVLLADDEQLVREGIQLILDHQPDIEVVASVADGPAAVREVLRQRPAVALLDVRMSGGDGLAAAREILRRPAGTTKVIMLTTFDLDEYVFAAFAVGASGFLLKSSPRAHLLHAVRTASDGDALLDPGLARRLIERHVRSTADPVVATRLASLSPREREVLTELVHGRSNAEIAADLQLGETTVKTHVAAVLHKLGLRDRLQAVIFGYESGLVRPGSS